MKSGEVIEPAVVTKLFDIQLIFNEEFTGVAYFYFDHKQRVGLARFLFKVPAKRIGAYTGYIGYFFQVDLFTEVTYRVLINVIEPVAF